VRAGGVNAPDRALLLPDLQPPIAGLASRARDPVRMVTAIVLLLYALWILAFVGSGHRALELVHIGRTFALQSHASAVIRFDSTSAFAGETGRDGQFYYFIAADPGNARYYLDSPNYRYERILYPLLARLLALGQLRLLPYTLLLLNWLAIGAGTLAVAAWLRRRGTSPWFALAFGLYPGLLIALGDDVTEPLAYALVAAAVYLFDRARGAMLWAAVAFALAILARETAALFAIPYGLSLLGATISGGDWRARVAANWRRAGLFLLVAMLPFIIYKAFLTVWLGPVGSTPIDALRLVPFAGILHYRPLAAAQLEEIRMVVFPSLIFLGMCAWAVWRRIWRVEVAVLLVNVLVLVVLLGAPSWVDITGSGRITTGMVLAAAFCLPTFRLLTGADYSWFLASAALWLSDVPFRLLGPIGHFFLRGL
jgi:hypothetical protein